MFPFGPVDLRIRDLEAAYPFYATLLPKLGFPRDWRGQGTFSFLTQGAWPQVSWFGVIEDRGHLPNATRIAFAAGTCAEVDRLAAIVRSAGASHVEGPEDMAYARIYRAVYFDDPSGNPLEIYYCEE